MKSLSNRSHTFVFACLAACLAGVAAARPLELMDGTTGKWSDSSMWYDTDAKVNTVPAAGDKLLLYSRPASLTMDADVSLPLQMVFCAATGKTLAFHGDGHVLEDKGSGIGVNPFYLYTPVNHCWQFLRAAGDGTAYRFENPELVISNVNGTSYFDFLKGSYNFYDPDGTARDITNRLFSAANDAAQIVFREGATLRAGTAILAAPTETSSIDDVALRFEGGSHTLARLRWQPSYATPHEMRVTLTDGARLTCGGVFLNDYSAVDLGRVDGKCVRAVLDLSAGSRLDAGTEGFSAKVIDPDIQADVRLDKATLTSEAGISFALAWANETNSLTAVDSTISCPNGTFTCGQFASKVSACSRGALTNSTLTARVFSFYTGADWYFKDCHLEATDPEHNTCMIGNRCAQAPDAAIVFDHCTITNAHLRAYPEALTSVMHFTGGTQADLWDLYLPQACDIRIDGGSRVSCMVNSGNRMASSCDLTITNAQFDASHATWYLGWGGEGCANVRVQEGADVYLGGKLIDGSTGASLYIGWAARACVEVSGGVLWANTIAVGRGEKKFSSDEHSVLKITGGEVHVRDTDKWAVLSCGVETGHGADVILDGGELHVPSVRGEGKGPTGFYANGGTLVPCWDVTGDGCSIITNIDVAELGPKGLTIDTRRYKAKLTQSMANASGAEGLFRKVGAKDLTLAPDAWTVSETRLEEGTLVMGRADETLNTKLVVAAGTTLSLAGECAALTLDGLSLEDATIVFDEGDVISVPAGKLQLSKLRLELVTDPTAAATNVLFVTTGGAVADDVAWAIQRAYVENLMPTGHHAEILTDYDSGTGVTTFKFAVSRDQEPLSYETEWKSSSGGGWKTYSSWSDGVPSEEKVAVFSTASGVAKTITIPAGATAGALAFRANGYTLAGANALEIAAKSGAALLTVETGSSVVSAPLKLDSVAAVTNVSGTKLTLSGALVGFGLEKYGKGELVLSGQNEFYRPLVQSEGRLVVRNANALGTDELENRIRLTADTLTFEEPSGKEMRIENAITVATPGKRGSAIIECRTPVTLANWQTTEQGALIKRGVAPLTIEVGGNIKLNAQCAMTWASYYPFTSVSFPADGTSPDGDSLPINQHYYTGFSIAEGEVIFKALPGLATRPKITSECQVFNCLQTLDGTATPTLTLDGVNLEHSNVTYLHNGASLKKDTHFCTTPVIRILNGARAYGAYVTCKRYGFTSGCQPVWAITNGTLQAKNHFQLDWLNEADGSRQAEDSYVVFKTLDAEMLSDTAVFDLHGAVRGDFVNTYLGPTDKTKYATILAQTATPESATTTSCGEMLFRSNSVFRVGAFSFLTADWQPKKEWAVFKLIFDGAEWQFGDDDWTLKKDWFNPTYRDDHFKVVSQGDGIILSPAEGKTWRTEFPISGDGGVTVNGPGSVKFDEGMYGMTGRMRALQGVLDLTDAGLLFDVVIAPGSGVIRGGKFYNATISLDEQGGAVPNFEDCTFSGTTRILIGGTLHRADDVLIGTYTGTFTGIETFTFPKRDGFRGENFRAQDGKITFRIASRLGLMVIIHH